MQEGKNQQKIGRYFAAFSVLGVLVVSVMITLRYQSDLRAARQRVNDGSQLVKTDCGLIEYAERGDGPPVFVIHGAVGGYDQGLLLGETLLGEGYRLIAPSRFGYLNSPVPTDYSLAAQAEAYACLLENLDLQAVPVVAISAGGLSGLQFALDHPERVSALVMVSAVSFTAPPTTEQSRTESLINSIIGNDLVYWLTIHMARKPALALFGVPEEVQAGLDPAQQAFMDYILAAMLPMSDRLEGILVDQSRYFPSSYLLDGIKVPILVIHARDDTLVDYSNGQHTAYGIPGAQFMRLESGGHLLMGRHEQVKQELAEFLTSSLANSRWIATQ